ncbi:MAG: CDP-diacylglycerol--glycerol-3-phosphate 3-phosphatidyltransferase, partial [Rickettsiales bacterium]|nr:CDP-diacylglycerol--glycerol-3-phosphate 3-phosphatidyltransferase [Rickettsiales bacterium]
VANLVVAVLFALASITDYFDGYFARSLKVESNFGKCLDPIADKLLVIVAIVMLISYSGENLFILIPGLIIICREVLVSGLREFLAEFKVSVPVTNLAKWKTGVQMTAITGLLLGESGSSYTLYYLLSGWKEMGLKFIIVDFVVFASQILFCAAAVLTVVTGFAYFRAGVKEM